MRIARGPLSPRPGLRINRALEPARSIRQHAPVREGQRRGVRRAPSSAPLVYWWLRSRVAELLCFFHARGIERRVARALRHVEQVTFAQVGSNDGVRGDPLRRLVLRHPDWTGVFAEPIPALYEQLVRSYPSGPGLHFEPVAVARESGRRRMFALSSDAADALGGRLPSWHDQIASLDAEHLITHLGERVRPYLVAHEVECVQLAELLARAGLSRIDLLHLDAEGADGEILAGLDLEDAAPSVIVFEHAHLPTEELRALREGLGAAGYRLSRHGGDTLAVRLARRRAAALP